jgi:hypothetical protein
MKTYWCVISKFYDNGVVEVIIKEYDGMIKITEIWPFVNCYIDWFNTEQEAKEFQVKIYTVKDNPDSLYHGRWKQQQMEKENRMIATAKKLRDQRWTDIAIIQHLIANYKETYGYVESLLKTYRSPL